MRKVFLIWLFVLVHCVKVTSGATDSGQWSLQEVIQSGTGLKYFSKKSVALDSQDNPHVICANEHELYYKYYDGSEWHFEIIDADIAASPSSLWMRYSLPFSIAIDSHDVVHIAYAGWSEQIKYAYGNYGSWTKGFLNVSPGTKCSGPVIKVDSKDRVHVAWLEVNVGDETKNACYASNSTGTWNSSYVFTGMFAGYLNMVIDSAGEPIILLPKDQYYYLYQLDSQSGLWVEETFNMDPNTIYFMETAIDEDDKLHIAYYTDLHMPYPHHTASGVHHMTNAAGTWDIEQIDVIQVPPTRYIVRPEVIVDSNDNIHIIYVDCNEAAYGDGEAIKYATGQYGSWDIEVACVTGINEYSVVLGDNNLAKIGFYEKSGAVKYLEQQTSGWTESCIDSGLYFNGPSSISVDNSGNVNILFYNTGVGKITLGRLEGAAWSIDNIASQQEPRQKLYIPQTVDSVGNIHAMDLNSSAWSYLSNSEGSWSKENVNDCVVDNVSIVTDVNDVVHAVIYGYEVITPWLCSPWTAASGLKLLTREASGWTERSLSHARCIPEECAVDIKADDKGHFHAAYISGTCSSSPLGKICDYNMVYGTDLTGSWTEQNIEDLGVSDSVLWNADAGKGSISIDLDSRGKAHVGYIIFDVNSFEPKLRYATNSSGSWQIETIAGGAQLASNCSIAIDLADQAYICYYDKSDEAVKVARGNFGDWQFETLENGLGLNGGKPDMKKDSSGNMHISYYNCNKQSLYYATNKTPKPAIAVEPESLDFVAKKNTTSKKIVTVNNNGNADLVIGSVVVKGPDADKFSIDNYCKSPVAPGDFCTINVTFDTSNASRFFANLEISSNDPQNSVMTIPISAFCYTLGQGDLGCKTQEVDFGQSYPGQTSEWIGLLIKNIGTGTLNIIAIGVDDSNFSCSKIPTPFSLSPSEFFKCDVRFHPSGPGSYSGIFNVSAGPSPSAIVNVLLLGECVDQPQPQIVVVPQKHDFGKVNITRSSPLDIMISNLGRSNLVITELAVKDQKNFSIDPNAGSSPLGTTPPFVILPEKTRTMQAIFNPLAIGSYSEELKIVSNDPVTYKIYIPLTGTAYLWKDADLNVDGFVDFVDLALLGEYWLDQPPDGRYDLSPEEGDNFIDIKDLDVLTQNWLEVLSF